MRRNPRRCCQGIEDMIGDATRLPPRLARRLLDENCRRAAGEIITIGVQNIGHAMRLSGVDRKSPDMVLAEPRNLAGDGAFSRVEQYGGAAWHAAPKSGILIARIVEQRHECFCGWIVPVLRDKGPAFWRQPFDIR